MADDPVGSVRSALHLFPFLNTSCNDRTKSCERNIDQYRFNFSNPEVSNAFLPKTRSVKRLFHPKIMVVR